MHIALFDEDTVSRQQMNQMINQANPNSEVCVLASENELLAILDQVDLAVLKVRGFQYLVKPVNQEQVQKYLRHMDCSVSDRNKASKDKVLLRTKTTTYSICKSEILYVENNLKKLLVHTTTDCIELYGSMKEMEHMLGKTFFRCHRGYLVGFAHIQSYQTNQITLENGEQLLLSKERYREFDSSYAEYLRQGMKE